MKLKKIAVYLFVCFFAVFTIAGCSAKKVTRVEPDEVIDLSGYWNDTDSQLVSKEMIEDALSRPWLEVFSSKYNKRPRVIVGTVLNKTAEHISTETFIKDLERELLNSGRVVFVASKDQRDEIRAERDDQAIHSRPDTVKQQGMETGADFMIKGQINSIMDAAGSAELKYYQIELEMIDIQSNEKVWIGQKKIKKVIAKKKYKA